MQRLPGPFRVYVGLIPTGYMNPDILGQAIRDGLIHCGAPRALESLKPREPVLIKTDVALVDKKIARHAYTHPEVARAALAQILSFAPQAKLTVTTEPRPGFPGYRALQKANGASEAFRLRGYYELEQMFPGRVSIAAEDELAAARYQLSKGGVLSRLTAGLPSESTARLRAGNEIVAPRNYADTSFVFYLPKIKGNILTQGFSGAVKLGASTDQQHDGAVSDHHICDKLEVCNPDVIVSDGIVAAVGGSALTQRDHELGVILVANNALAHDIVAAQILNLDPNKITHLKLAMERGWGPAATSQIELGGAGAEGIRQLAQKSKLWEIGVTPVKEFGHKYEQENPGLTFPFELISGPPSEGGAGAHGLLLDWLHMSYDFPQQRARIARWPRLSICVGALAAVPTSYVVCAIGAKATQSLELLTSRSSKWASLPAWGIGVSRVQLKNGSRHLVFSVASRPRAIWLALWLATLGRAGRHLIRPALLLDRWVFSWLTRWRASRHPSRRPVLLTSRLKHNAWWALKAKTAPDPIL